ncbi:hypothetical protein GCM10022245_18040 [Streptomyces mayteni]
MAEAAEAPAVAAEWAAASGMRSGESDGSWASETNVRRFISPVLRSGRAYGCRHRKRLLRHVKATGGYARCRRGLVFRLRLLGHHPEESRTDRINYAEDPRSNAEINSIGEETGYCPAPGQ